VGLTVLMQFDTDGLKLVVYIKQQKTYRRTVKSGKTSQLLELLIKYTTKNIRFMVQNTRHYAYKLIKHG